jgi:TRAP-type C4-dicarboxylate transport system substrate-binding protein
MKTSHLKMGSTFAAATAIAFAASISLASAASFTLKIGSGQPMKPLEPINQANYYFVPTVEKKSGGRNKP